MSVVLTLIALLIPAFALVCAPPVLTIWLLCGAQRSPTMAVRSFLRKRALTIHSFGTMLEPRYVVGARALDQ